MESTRAQAPEPGRHVADQIPDSHEGELGRAAAIGATRGEGPGPQSMAAFRALPDRHEGDLARRTEA
ncbi:MAG: hypothetical protein D6686_14365 [Alphaproteobacteria bacterium]|nr:MAG: hypothetical protein D6686_14365 [Alphaproteobacteria bacterium]